VVAEEETETQSFRVEKGSAVSSVEFREELVFVAWNQKVRVVLDPDDKAAVVVGIGH